MIPQGIITAYQPIGVKSARKKIDTDKIIHSGLIFAKYRE